MAVQAQARVITVQPDEVLARVLDAADSTPVIVERDGVRYRVEREPALPRVRRDPERFREMLRRTAGTLANVDVEELKRDLREQREQNSHGRPAE